MCTNYSGDSEFVFDFVLNFYDPPREPSSAASRQHRAGTENPQPTTNSGGPRFRSQSDNPQPKTDPAPRFRTRSENPQPKTNPGSRTEPPINPEPIRSQTTSGLVQSRMKSEAFRGFRPPRLETVSEVVQQGTEAGTAQATKFEVSQRPPSKPVFPGGYQFQVLILGCCSTCT